LQFAKKSDVNIIIKQVMNKDAKNIDKKHSLQNFKDYKFIIMILQAQDYTQIKPS